MTPAFLLLVTVFGIWPDFVSPCGPKPEGPKEPQKDCYCGLANRRQTSKIAGGKKTDVNKYPWQVYIRIQQIPVPYCGGSVLSNQWILTAAHCFESWITKSDVKVYLGDHNYKIPDEAKSIPMDVAEIILHDKWIKRNIYRYDFALLKLTDEIDFQSHPHIRPICLPADGSKKDYSDYVATATGWGGTSWGGTGSPHLLEVDLTVVTETECREHYDSTDIEQLLCTKGDSGKGICSGDSGGPLVTKEDGSSGTDPGQNYELIGVTSFTKQGTCKGTVQGFARVTAQLKWIREKIKGSRICPRI